MRRPLIGLCLAIGIVSTPAAAPKADVVQALGPLVALRINASTSDEYPLFHGFIIVGDSVGGYARYNWGGSFCPGLALTEAQVAALQAAMDNPRILIGPRTHNGQGGNLCVVAFTLVHRSETGALP